MFDMVSTIYLVTQIGIAELRNSNRLITGCLQPYAQKLEIVLNRHKDKMFGIEVQAIEKALTRQADWRIPNDYAAVMRNAKHRNAISAEGVENSAGDPDDGPVRVRASADQKQRKKKKFGLFGFASGV